MRLCYVSQFCFYHNYYIDFFIFCTYLIKFYIFRLHHQFYANNYNFFRIAANDGLMDLMPPDEAEEIKNGQWMGVTVRSQGIGGKVSIANNP